MVYTQKSRIKMKNITKHPCNLHWACSIDKDRKVHLSHRDEMFLTWADVDIGVITEEPYSHCRLYIFQ